MEPVGNLANVEELDLKTGQRTGCAEIRVCTDTRHHLWSQEDVLTPYGCGGNSPKGRWGLLQSPPGKWKQDKAKSATWAGREGGVRVG